MRKHLEPRRYLIEFSSAALPHVFTDVLVIGSGVAGLGAALTAAASPAQPDVLVICKDALDETSTSHAQGGIAVALDPADSPDAHFRDTLQAGYGLCHPDVVRAVVTEGPERIRELMAWGAHFDRRNDHFDLAHEGGHCQPRIIHARGDSTGAEVQDILLRRVRATPRIRVLEYTFAIDLLTQNNTCLGVLVHSRERGLLLIWAAQTILATGGAGQVYRETTNPEVATGDGLAMAYRAGAQIRDLEFVQFHPTTLYLAGARRILITEAVRGAGAVLRNRYGERFMPAYHEAAELAPRDVVSRAILAETHRTGDTNVYLDLTHLPPQVVDHHFPRLHQLREEFDLDPLRDLIPVFPSAHYMVGGVTVDVEARTTVQNLLACGEVASTGLHGANRLGSNSLLEGLVFGVRAGRTAASTITPNASPHAVPRLESHLVPRQAHIDLVDVSNSLKSVMWRHVGLERSEKTLADAEERIDFWCSYVLNNVFEHPAGWTLQNLLTIAKLITVGARRRQESRGCHYRTDFPHPDDKHWKHHNVIQRPIAGD